MEIPNHWIDLATRKVDSKFWKSSGGIEYSYQADADWVVINEIMGPYRIRHICRIIKTFEIKPNADESPGRTGG